MPLYTIQHTTPLTYSQKQSLAQQITSLHSTTFLTPSLFVHVNFEPQPPSHPSSSSTTPSDYNFNANYFLAGKPRVSSNRVLAMVRTSAGRTKGDWDLLAERIEGAWGDVVGGQGEKLVVVAFYAMVGAREGGVVVPLAGEEASWFKEMKPEFQRRAEAGEVEYRDLLEEVESREDLKKAYGA